MSTIRFETQGNFKKIDNFLMRLTHKDPVSILNRYGEMGLERLKEATPKDTGLTANSWSYKVEKTPFGYTVSWNNSNRASNGAYIVILLQYGHGTRGGTWVEGRDFINPALRSVFEEMAHELGKEVTNG